MYEFSYGKISERFNQIVEVTLSEPDYSFDILGIWKAEDGYYLSTDSGCSCPMPWESHCDEDLTGPLTAAQAIEEATSLWTLAGKYDEAEFASAIKLLV